MATPTDRKYSDKHVWAKLSEGKATFGLTEYNISRRGSVTSVDDLVTVGTGISKGDVIGKIIGSASNADLYAPLGGQVTAREEHMQDIDETNTTHTVRIAGSSE